MSGPLTPPPMPPMPPMPPSTPTPSAPPSRATGSMFQKPAVIGVVVALVVALVGVGVIINKRKGGGEGDGGTVVVDGGGTGGGGTVDGGGDGGGTGGGGTVDDGGDAGGTTGQTVTITDDEVDSGTSLTFVAPSGWDCTVGDKGYSVECLNSTTKDYVFMSYYTVSTTAAPVDATAELNTFSDNWLKQDGYSQVKFSDPSPLDVSGSVTSGAFLNYEGTWNTSSGSYGVYGAIISFVRGDGVALNVDIESTPDHAAFKANTDSWGALLDAAQAAFSAG